MSATIEDDVMTGAWRTLCVGVMLQAVQRLAAETNLFHRGAYLKTDGRGGNCKERLHQRTGARAWLDGGVGLVTFEDCCAALEVDPDRAREKILAYCHARRRKQLRDNPWA